MGPPLAGAVDLVQWLRDVGLSVQTAGRAATAEPDVVLVHCPSGTGPVARVVHRAASRYSAPLVVISDEGRPDDVVDALAAGAQGWLDIGFSDTAVRASLTEVAAGGIALSRGHVAVVVAELRRRNGRSVRRADGSLVRLAPREWEVLEVLAGGGSTADAARRLGVGPTAVRGYASSAAKRLQVEGRAEAVRLFAAKHGGS